MKDLEAAPESEYVTFEKQDHLNYILLGLSVVSWGFRRRIENAEETTIVRST